MSTMIQVKMCIRDRAEAMQVDFAGVAEEDFLKLIRKSVAVKAAIVQSDPREKGLRKALNFGHTVGHAIESCLLYTSHDFPVV